MATAVEPATRIFLPEQRVVLHGIGWDGYETMLRLVGDRPSPRLTYDRGDLELMSPSYDHERFKKWLGRLVELIAEEIDVPFGVAGSTTWRTQADGRGLEADDCYYFANTHRILGKTTIDLDVDPPPDLAIEVEISPSAVGRMGLYAALGVPEVWRFDGESLRVEQLQGDGSYSPSATSRNLPALPLDQVPRWLGLAETLDQRTWARQLRAWVRAGFPPEGDARP